MTNVSYKLENYIESYTHNGFWTTKRERQVELFIKH